MAAPGSYFLVEYDGYEGMHHERLVLAQAFGEGVAPGSYLIRTPEGDQYVEEISAMAADISDFRLLQRQGDLPPGMAEDDVHRFVDPPTGAVLAEMIRQAAIAVGQPAPLPAPLPRAVGVVGRAGAGVERAAAGMVWVALEDVGDVVRGDTIREVPQEAEVRGSVGLFPDGAGGLVARRLVPVAEVEKIVHDDLRVLSVEEDAGRRHRSFQNAVAALMTDAPEGGLGLEGPPCVYEKTVAIRDSAGCYTAAHQQWIQASRIPDGDRGIYEHEVLCRSLDAMLMYDQMNLPALRSAEILVRRLMLIEEAYSMCPSSPDFGGADIYMGWSALGSGGAGAVAPMRAHVAEQLRGRAAVAKEQRKAREEVASKRSLRRDKRGGKNGSKGGEE